MQGCMLGSFRVKLKAGSLPITFDKLRNPNRIYRATLRMLTNGNTISLTNVNNRFTGIDFCFGMLRCKKSDQEKNNRQQEACDNLFCMPDEFHFSKYKNKNPHDIETLSNGFRTVNELLKTVPYLYRLK